MSDAATRLTLVRTTKKPPEEKPVAVMASLGGRRTYLVWVEEED